MTEEAYGTKVGQNQEEALSFMIGIFFFAKTYGNQTWKTGPKLPANMVVNDQTFSLASWLKGTL